MGLFSQKDYSGGLNLLTSDTLLNASEYRLLVNARNRFGPIEPVQKHIELDNAPIGLKQGIIGVGATVLLFVGGKGYYRVDGDDTWHLLLGLQMDPSVEQYYLCAVPASFKDFVRKSNANVSAPITITNDFKVNGTPAGVVVQDGITQPWFVEFDIANDIWVARQLGDYHSWANINIDASDREYVPIGKQMCYISGKLLIVSRDGTQVYHSISGRPLDFMVITDTNGNKLPLESNGGAERVSYGFDFDVINCMIPCNTPDSFWIGSSHNLRIITLDYTRTIYGEPLYNVSGLFNVGVVNQFSLIDTLGDFACIDFDGVKSINAVQSLKFRGRNSIFSLNVMKLFRTSKTKRIKQKDTSCIQFDNYILFNVDTRYGNLTLVYDLILSKWISFDITRVHHVKQFTTTEIPTETKLYCITKDNKVWQMFADSVTEVAIARTKSYIRTDSVISQTEQTGFGQTEHKGQMLNCAFVQGTFTGKCEVVEYIDEQESVASREIKAINVIIPGIKFPIRMPVVPNTQQQVNNLTFSLTKGLSGKKVSYIIMWNNDCHLLEHEVMTSDIGNKVSGRQKQEVYKKN